MTVLPDPPVFAGTPMAQITPFTYREGATLMYLIERLKRWSVELGPSVQAVLDKALEELTEYVDDAKNFWQNKFDDFMANIIKELEALNDQAVAQLILNINSETREAIEEWYMLYGGDALNRSGQPFGDRNLNTVTDAGFYYQFGIANVTTSNNYPFSGSSCFGRVYRYSDNPSRIVQKVTATFNGRTGWRRSSDGGATWTLWEFYPTEKEVDTAIREHIAGYYYPVKITNNVFSKASGSDFMVLHSANSVELIGILVINADDVVGSDWVEVGKLPPDAIPAIVYPRFFTHTTGLASYNIRVTNNGIISVRSVTGMLPSSTELLMTAFWLTGSKATTAYGRLFRRFFYGEDYQTTKIIGTNKTLSSIAIHGGEVEEGSEELARELALRTGASLYAHDAMVQRVWNGMHVFDAMHPSSNGYDDPDALEVVTQSKRCVSFHGAADGAYNTIGAVSFVGGLDIELREAISRELRAAGFTVMDNPSSFPLLAGTNPTNICNRTTIAGGVQIEATNTQRRAFFPGNDYSRTVRKSGQRTGVFDQYISAIERAIDSVE